MRIVNMKIRFLRIYFLQRRNRGMKPWIIVLIVLAVIAVILGLLYYFGKKAQTKQAAQFLLCGLFCLCFFTEVIQQTKDDSDDS